MFWSADCYGLKHVFVENHLPDCTSLSSGNLVAYAQELEAPNKQPNSRVGGGSIDFGQPSGMNDGDSIREVCHDQGSRRFGSGFEAR